MDAAEVPGAVAACRAVAVAAGLRVDDAAVLNDSNRLAVHLTGCEVLARVTPRARQDASQLEVDVARLLVDTDAPVGLLDPRIEARVHEHDGFAITMWTYLAPVPPHDIAPDEYAHALERMHAGLRQVDLTDHRMPHFTDRVTSAQRLVDDPTNNPDIAGADREVIAAALRALPAAITHRGAAEQLLHGEPHPGNVLRTQDGLVFVDLETCCVGPVELDIAHATIEAIGSAMEVGSHYPGADPALVRDCWILSLALVTAWRCQPGDDLPDGAALAREWIRQVRAALDP